MRQILKKLNDEAQITGSMVITQDGIMVAAALGRDLEEDALAAFASSLLVSMKRGLAQIRAPGNVVSCTLKGSTGKISFFDMENSYLVAVTDAEAQLDSKADAIWRAIERIRSRRIG
jgi:predicted regulator of Ras-like GTPase activity (Roadblock/LC7/MglB family)